MVIVAHTDFHFFIYFSECCRNGRRAKQVIFAVFQVQLTFYFKT